MPTSEAYLGVKGLGAWGGWRLWSLGVLGLGFGGVIEYNKGILVINSNPKN